MRHKYESLLWTPISVYRAQINSNIALYISASDSMEYYFYFSYKYKMRLLNTLQKNDCMPSFIDLKQHESIWNSMKQNESNAA